MTRGQKLAEWDPFTLPIITERAGKLEFVDLIENVTLVDRQDDVTGLSFKEVVEYKAPGKAVDLRPRLILRDEKNSVVKRENGTEAIYFLTPGTILSIDNGAAVAAGDVLARLPRESSKTRDITGGLPRVAELFEARRPKDHAIISEIDGRVEFGKDYKAKRRILVVPEAAGDEQPAPREYLVPKGKHVSVQEGDYVKRGDPLVDGPRVPHDILRVLGVEKLADYLVEQIQEVYRLQGVKINDKHIEVIVRQMLQKVEVTDPGDTTYLIGETGRPHRVRDREREARRGQGTPRGGRAGAAGHHQGVAADDLVHLRRLLPGDDAGADRGRDGGQGRLPGRPEGERDRGPPDPGGHGLGDEPPARPRRAARQGPPARLGAGAAGAPRGGVTAARRKSLGGPATERVPAPFHVMAWMLTLAALILGAPAAAQDWPAEKCRRYAQAWDAATQRLGTEGLSPGLPRRASRLPRLGLPRARRLPAQPGRHRDGRHDDPAGAERGHVGHLPALHLPAMTRLRDIVRELGTHALDSPGAPRR